MRSSRPKIAPNCGSVFPVISLGALAVAAGAFHGNPVAFAYGVPLLVGPLLLYIYLRLALARVEVDRQILPAVFEGETVKVTVRLHNRFRLPLFYPHILDVFVPELHARKQVFFPYRILPGETVEETYSGQCLLPRGVYLLGSGLLSISDPFGWIQLTRAIPHRHQLKVYPGIQDFGLPEKLGAVISAMLDESTCPKPGESLEFCSAREYRFGDPLRKIHWPLTARRGFPVVREFTRNSVGNLNLFVDLHRPALIGIGRGSSLEHAVKISVALASRALSGGVGVRVFAHGKDRRVLPVGCGSRQLGLVLDFVTRVRPDGNLPLTGLLAHHEPELGRGDCVFFTVSPYLFGDDDFLARLRTLRARGLRLVAGIFDDVSFRALFHGEQPCSGSRDRFVMTLTSLGVETLDIACGADLSLIFREGRRR